MKVDKGFIDMLKNDVRSYSFEVGGILGEKNGVICEFVLDEGSSLQHRCSYVPDVCFLNKQIECWSANNIIFVGMFHTHLGGSRKLSLGDMQYIEKIMNYMPDYVSKLYFPIIVFPENEIVFYKAIKNESEVFITEEHTIQII